MAARLSSTCTRLLLLLLLAVVPSLSLPPPPSSAPHGQPTVHERRSSAPHSPWTKRARMAHNDTIELRIGLRHRNTHLGHDMLMAVADPQSPAYGRHWTAQQVTEAFAPSDETVRAATDWVSSVLPGVAVGLASGRNWLRFRASVGEAEALLGAEYWFYEHGEDRRRTAVGVEHYSVPAEVRPHVDFVSPGVVLGEVRRPATTRAAAVREKRRTGSSSTSSGSSSSSNASCAELVTPQCIKRLYGLPTAPPDTAPAPAANNSLGIFQHSSWHQNRDLDLFFAAYAPEIPQGTRPRNLSVDQAAWFYDSPGDVYATYPQEADLDLEVAWPIVYPQNVTVFQVDDVYYNLYAPQVGIFNTFLDAIDGAYCDAAAYGETGDNPAYDAVYPDYHTVTDGRGGSYDPGTYKGPRMCGVYEATSVLSISYSEPETSFSEAYEKRQCDEFLKLGLMGVSVVVASGDSGPLAKRNCQATNLGAYVTQNPVNCPYVTAVGATRLLATGDEEAARDDDWASSGGFSTRYATPAYQRDALAAYNSNTSSVGRGVPDLAAVGVNIAVAVDGALTTQAGTSAAAPLVAAMLGAVNEARRAAGKAAPVGFVNPVLYGAEAARARVFRDVTRGNSSMCGGLVAGFQAREGWDPVTGLGTPRWAALRDVFMALP